VKGCKGRILNILGKGRERTTAGRNGKKKFKRVRKPHIMQLVMVVGERKGCKKGKWSEVSGTKICVNVSAL